MCRATRMPTSAPSGTSKHTETSANRLKQNRKIVNIAFLGKSDMTFEISVKIKVVYRDVQIYCDLKEMLKNMLNNNLKNLRKQNMLNRICTPSPCGVGPNMSF